MIRAFRDIVTTRILSILLLSITLYVAGNEPSAVELNFDQGSNELEAAAEETQSDPTVTYLKVSDALQSHFQVDLSFHSFLLDVVVDSVENQLPTLLLDQFIPSVSKTFKILLRQIISTNAP